MLGFLLHLKTYKCLKIENQILPLEWCIDYRQEQKYFTFHTKIEIYKCFYHEMYDKRTFQ